jgi:type I restriction enzyme M protein
MSLSNTIKSIQDIMRKDAGVDGDAQRISQLVWLIFLKIFDDKEREAELMQDSYRSPIPEKYRWRTWAADPEGITGEGMLDFVNNDLFPALKELHTGKDMRAYVVQQVFIDSYNYMKNGTLLRQVVNKISEIDFNSSEDRHLFGDLYEQILKDLQSAGNAGEYYTPRAVTQFIVDMVDPKLGETLLDPACGTGGFLSCAIEHIRSKTVKTPDDEQRMQNAIHGVEKKPLPHMLCTTNMLLHGIDTPVNIRHDNTLARPLRDIGPKDRKDVIITNPPFGGMEEDGIETNFPATFRTRETADLFLVLIIQMLKPQGRCGIVLPDGTLFGEGIKTRIKEKLLKECNLHTIVRLPKGVFNPYTGINTNLLFFEKGKPTKEIWYYEHPYPEGYVSYSKTRPLRIQEFDAEKAWWNDRTETEHAWRVPVEEIISRNYNLDWKNPNTPTEDHGDPAELVSCLNENKQKLNTSLLNLKAEFDNCLKGDPSYEVVTNNLDWVLTASDGVKRLRDFILQLAVQGRLVEQKETDGTAADLLKQIKEAKRGDAETRRKNGERIRTAKVLPPIEKNEIPFDIPKNWEWVRMRSAFSDLGQKVPNQKFCYIDVSAINKERGVVTSDDVKVLESAEAPSRARKLVCKGSVIYSTVRPYLLNIAVIKDDFELEPIVSTAFAVLKPWAGTSEHLLYYYLRSPAFTKYVESKQKGVAYPAISESEFNIGLYPLPPLAEQRRIVKKVDELMTWCDELENLLQIQTDTAQKFAAAIAHQGAA